MGKCQLWLKKNLKWIIFNWLISQLSQFCAPYVGPCSWVACCWVKSEVGFCCWPCQLVTNALCVMVALKQNYCWDIWFQAVCVCVHMCRCLDKEQLGSCTEGGKPAQSDLHCSSAGILVGSHVPTTFRWETALTHIIFNVKTFWQVMYVLTCCMSSIYSHDLNEC